MHHKIEILSTDHIPTGKRHSFKWKVKVTIDDVPVDLIALFCYKKGHLGLPGFLLQDHYVIRLLEFSNPLVAQHKDFPAISGELRTRLLPIINSGRIPPSR